MRKQPKKVSILVKKKDERHLSKISFQRIFKFVSLKFSRASRSVFENLYSDKIKIKGIDFFENLDSLSIDKTTDSGLLIKQIKDALMSAFLESSIDEFITVVILRVLEPIQKEINIASHFSEVKTSRSNRKTRLKMLLKKDFLINLRNQILIDYKEQLKEVELYKEFLIEKANDRFLILNPAQDYPIEFFTSNQFDNILKEATNKVISYFENQLITNPSYKDELFFFDSRVCSCIKEKENDINKINQNIIDNKKEQQKNIKSLSPIEKKYFYSHPSEKLNLTPKIEVNRVRFIDCLLENEINLECFNELEMFKKHKAALEKLQSNLHKSYLFLKLNKPKKGTPLTVFGDRDINKLEQLYFELEDFLETSIQLEDITNVFALNYEPKQKINLRNGTTNDFAYLINQMHPFFISEIADRKKYNQWWADRFTFNGVEKSKEAIIKIRSNTKKDITRKQEKTIRLNSIVDVLR